MLEPEFFGVFHLKCFGTYLITLTDTSAVKCVSSFLISNCDINMIAEFKEE